MVAKIQQDGGRGVNWNERMGERIKKREIERMEEEMKVDKKEMMQKEKMM